MSNNRFDLADAIAVLERTPGTLRAMLAGLPASWTDANDGEGTWSTREVLVHLEHGEREVWITRARTILEHGRGRAFDTFDRTAQFAAGADKSVETLLDEFERARKDSLKTLRAWEFTEEQFALEGEHPSFGRVTLGQLLATWVAHDLGHLVQITRTMARRYREDVGPWREFLSVMSR